MRHIAFLGLALCLTTSPPRSRCMRAGRISGRIDRRLGNTTQDQEHADLANGAVKIEEHVSPESLARRPSGGVGGISSSGGLSNTICVCEVYSKVDGTCIWLTC